jgi:hypothetical protein
MPVRRSALVGVDGEANSRFNVSTKYSMALLAPLRARS